MKFRAQTLSGAQYVIDTDAMTWLRTRPVETQQGIFGLDRDNGKLIEPTPEPHIGERMVIHIEFPEDPRSPINRVTTTALQRIELL